MIMGGGGAVINNWKVDKKKRGVIKYERSVLCAANV